MSRQLILRKVIEVYSDQEDLEEDEFDEMRDEIEEQMNTKLDAPLREIGMEHGVYFEEGS